jgi:phosphopantothenoylcysteine decarboxylase / phosphopantothenate---cysteine ligase
VSGSLKGKNIVLGVSGGISAYKSADLLRLLMKEGATVKVAMSANAKKFITPLTFRALSGSPVYQNVFEEIGDDAMEHIRFSEQADLMAVVPASANSIAKMAHGLADDALSTLFVSFSGKVVIAPAMNDKMYSNPAVIENINKLKSRGICIVEPEYGKLACGAVGKGRLAELDTILEKIIGQLCQKDDLAGKKIIVTAGPTREAIDPVRFISNRSSGKMGYAIASEASKRGGEVTLISGPTNLVSPPGIETLYCECAKDMRGLVFDKFPECKALIMTAAVGDFSPESYEENKIKKDLNGGNVLKLKRNPDILGEIATRKDGQIVVGFAAESENVFENALEKLQKKSMDLIVANNIVKPGIGFGSDYNEAIFIKKDRQIKHLDRMPKTELANLLLDEIVELIEIKC